MIFLFGISKLEVILTAIGRLEGKNRQKLNNTAVHINNPLLSEFRSPISPSFFPTAYAKPKRAFAPKTKIKAKILQALQELPDDFFVRYFKT